jgi:lysophospholipase L1-like esterase
VAAIVVALALAEAAVRLLGIGPVFFFVSRETVQLSDNPVLGYEPRPGAEDEGELVSSAGLRDREHERAKPEGVLRIVVAGDSVTWGAGVRRDEAYPERLEALLNQCAGRPAFEVLNLGVPGYNVSQAVERARVLGLSFDPDLVIYGYVLNDPMDYSVELETLRAMQGDAERRIERQSSWLQRNSRLYALAVHGLRQRVEQRPLDRRRLSEIYNREEAWRSVRRGSHLRYFSRLHEEPDSWGRVQGGLETLGRELDAARVAGAVAVFPLNLKGGFASYPLRALHEKVGAEASRQGLAVIDLLPVFAERAGAAAGATLFKDPFHPSVEGHELVARAILRGLCSSPAAPLSRAGVEGEAACRCAEAAPQ